MRQPLQFIIHSDGAHDPTIVRAIGTAAQVIYERTERRQIETIILSSAEHIKHDSNDPASAPHWLAACAVARSQYARIRALAADPLEPDRNDSRRFVRLLGREQKRYDLPPLPGWPFGGATVEVGLRSIVAMFLPNSLRSLDPPPSPYVERVVIETAQLAVAFNDETFLQLAQDRLFGLGVGWKSRARLAKYLHPYPTGLNSSSPEERLSKILGAGNPVLYVRQSYNDQHAVRHGKPSATNAESDKRARCQFTVEQIMDGAERIPASLRDQAIRYLSTRENAGSAVLNSVSLDFIKPLLPERDARSLQTLSEHSWEGIAKLLSHAEYESLRRAVKKLPRTWSRDSLVEYAEAYLAEQRLQAEDLASTSGDSEPPTATSAAGERDDSIRFGRAVFPFKGAPENPKAYSDLVRNPSTLAAVRALRQADFEREVHGIPSGRPMQERTPKGSSRD
jgi:hypothetical protein